MMSQGTDYVTTYYSKMRYLWDEIDVMVPTPSCDCQESNSHVEHLRQQRLVQFLVGLNESYAQVRSSILLGSPVPSVNQAYAMAIQEESQRKLGLMEGGKDPMTMLAGRGSRFNNQPQNSQYPPNTSQSKKNQGHVSQGRKIGVICEHCGYKSHTKETCYRIVGFPTDFKSKRRVATDEDSMPHAHVSTAEAGSSTSGGGTAAASGSDSSHFHFPGGYFTKEHYDQVLKMMVSQPT
ncbi:hypothetical protein KY284_010923 [Solanum tuberosum]|nr:hypothetical protein KY284_010923 [Solanum tuberosum]